MCVYAVGSPIREPRGMNEEYGKHGESGQDNHPQQYYDITEQPQDKFYKQGVFDRRKVWWEVITTSISNARGRCLITVVAVLALCKIACEFIGKGSNNLSYKSIIGSLLIALMIFITGLVSLRRVEDKNDAEQKEKRKKDKTDSTESGPGGSSPSQDRRASGGDRSSNLDGSDK
jgi:hypothetical protein